MHLKNVSFIFLRPFPVAVPPPHIAAVDYTMPPPGLPPVGKALLFIHYKSHLSDLFKFPQFADYLILVLHTDNIQHFLNLEID